MYVHVITVGHGRGEAEELREHPGESERLREALRTGELSPELDRDRALYGEGIISTMGEIRDEEQAAQHWLIYRAAPAFTLELLHELKEGRRRRLSTHEQDIYFAHNRAPLSTCVAWKSDTKGREGSQRSRSRA